MVDLVSDSDEEFDWDSDGGGQVAGSLNGAGTSGTASRNLDAPGPSTLAGTSSNLVETYVEMGFDKEMVLKAIKENGDGDTESLVLLLLTYKAIGDDNDCSISACSPRAVVDVDDDEDILENCDDEDAGGSNIKVHNSNDDAERDFKQQLSEGTKLKSLVKMGFPEDKAKMAITRCGHNASISVLVDSIHASEIAGDGYLDNVSHHEDNSHGGREKQMLIEGNRKKRKRYGDGAQVSGFNLTNGRWRSLDKRLPAEATGPPYFYYEKVAVTPGGVWTRFLRDIAPEFVDSKEFCAAAGKKAFIHNLPIENRSPPIPLPPQTISEAFPHTKEWWPSWDPRVQLNLNFLQSTKATGKVVNQICANLRNSGDPPPSKVQKIVSEECRKSNLVWVGRNKVAPLEPHEIELLLGFPVDHTRGISRTQRYKALGNSFQVETIAYHLSVLKDMFPQGMNVLSVFSGIGGAEVALDRLGIHMKIVISVEESEVNRTVLKSWWDENQTGTLIQISDVKGLTSETIEEYVKRYGGFDLVIRGSPCNTFAVINRRDGLEGENPALSYDYFRILDAVMSIMGRSRSI